MIKERARSSKVAQDPLSFESNFRFLTYRNQQSFEYKRLTFQRYAYSQLKIKQKEAKLESRLLQIGILALPKFIFMHFPLKLLDLNALQIPISDEALGKTYFVPNSAFCIDFSSRCSFGWPQLWLQINSAHHRLNSHLYFHFRTCHQHHSQRTHFQ